MDELNIISTLNELTTVFLIIAAVFFIAAVALFFALDIPRVIGDLTGRTAKKEIANIRAQNLSGGPKAYKPSTVNRQRGKITEKIGANMPKKSMKLAGPTTEKIEKYTHMDEETELLNLSEPGDETELLGDNGSETSVLSENSSNFFGINETTVLGSQVPKNETTILNKNVSQTQNSGQTTILNSEKTMTVLQEILFVHTNEFIT